MPEVNAFKIHWIKKLFPAVLVFLVFCFPAAAFAAQEQVEEKGVTRIEAEISIPKGVSVYGSGDSCPGPEVTYSYRIDPVEVPVTKQMLADYAEGKVVLRSGIGEGARLADSFAVFRGGKVPLTEGRAEVVDDIIVSIELGAFCGPGIYRYLITDCTDPEKLRAAGIDRPEGYGTSHFLDVYLKKNKETKELEVYAFILSAGEAEEGEEPGWQVPAERHGFLAACESDDLTDKFYAPVQLDEAEVPLAAPEEEKSISPTGIVSSAAPFAFMLSAGILMLALLKRR